MEKLIVTAILLLSYVGFLQGQRICTGKRDIGFIVDSSGSIGSHYGKEKSFVKKVAEKIGISLSGTRAGVVLFSYKAILKVKLNQYNNTADFNRAVDNLEHLRYKTRTGLALTVALEQLFTIPNGMRANVPNVLILLTDGKANDKQVVATAVRRIRKAGIKLVVIGIGASVSRPELLEIVEKSDHLYLPNTFQELLSKKFINDIVGESCPIIASMYYVSQDKQTWSHARQKCQAMAGYLVDLNNKDEIALVRSKLPSARTASYWTGLSKSGGAWKWTDGSSAIHTSWAKGEPSGDGKCVSFDHVINNNGPYHWNDQPCFATHNYVCEIPIAASIYYVSQDKQTWSNARQKCQAMAGHLVDFNTKDEIALVRSRLPSTRTASYWTGLSKSGGVWKWTDGSSATYTNWAKGEPSGDGKCVSFDHVINNNGPYRWNDQPCFATHKYVCEIPRTK